MRAQSALQRERGSSWGAEQPGLVASPWVGFLGGVGAAAGRAQRCWLWRSLSPAATSGHKGNEITRSTKRVLSFFFFLVP